MNKYEILNNMKRVSKLNKSQEFRATFSGICEENIPAMIVQGMERVTLDVLAQIEHGVFSKSHDAHLECALYTFPGIAGHCDGQLLASQWMDVSITQRDFDVPRFTVRVVCRLWMYQRPLCAGLTFTEAADHVYKTIEIIEDVALQTGVVYYELPPLAEMLRDSERLLEL